MKNILILGLLFCCERFRVALAFSSHGSVLSLPNCRASTKKTLYSWCNTRSSSQIKEKDGASALFSLPNDSNRNGDDGNDGDDESNTDFDIFSRFTSPKIDDKGLPIADSLLAQIVAPTMQITWLSIAHAPIPTWLYSTTAATNGMLFPSSTSSGSGLLIVPTLIHGAGLTLCWILGCLAAKNFESDAFNISGGRGYKTVIIRLVQSGSFAIGLLILATQIDLLVEYGRYVQPGESEEIDVRLLNAIVEVINDSVFEAGVLSAWRIYRASLTGNEDGRPPNYIP